MRRRLARLPVRVRATLAFAGVMCLVLGATGLFLYLRLGAELDESLQQGLRSRAGDVAALVEQSGSGLERAAQSPLTEQGENIAQILDASGAIVDATPAVRGRPLLSDAQLAAARRGTVTVDRTVRTEEDERVRLLATPVEAQGRALVVVVGSLLEDRDDALANLGALLLTGLPIAVLLASLAGYAAVALALRPVESMRRRAERIRATEPGVRLPVPPAEDELARLGRTLNEMLQRLEESLDRERTFVADASHELRTPLAILKTELELALRGERSRAELERALHSAAEETERLVRLAEDLLVIARADRGRLPIRTEAIDACALLQTVEERFAHRAAERSVELRVRAAPGPALSADAVRLEQALGNLVDNSLRHGAGRVELAAERAGAAVELHVRDDGPGFPPDFISSAFERFTRGDPARGRGGAGLGLAIVAAIARAHGGAVGARNLEPGGADVWLSLPAA
jgi:two-component system, OmpR family, sensor kinase